MQPLHRPFTKMRRHIGIESGVDRASAQPCEHDQRDHHPPLRDKGKAGQRYPGEQAAGHKDAADAHPCQQESAEEAGSHITGYSSGQKHADCIQRDGKNLLDRRPANAKQATWQTEGDKSNNCQQYEACIQEEYSIA